MAVVRFGLLGPLSVGVDAVEVFPSSRLRRGLLAVLVLHPNQMVPIEQIMSKLWDGLAPPSAKANLRTQLASLRRDLEHLCPGMSARLKTQRAARGGAGGGLRMVIKGNEVDLDQAKQLLAVAKSDLRRAGDASQALLQCHRAFKLWRGDFGSDLPDTKWIAAQAEASRTLKTSLVETMCRARLLTGDHASALSDIKVALADEPYQARLWMLLIAACFMVSGGAQAMSEIRLCREKFSSVGMDLPAPVASLQRPILEDDRQSVLRAIIEGSEQVGF